MGERLIEIVLWNIRNYTGTPEAILASLQTESSARIRRTTLEGVQEKLDDLEAIGVIQWSEEEQKYIPRVRT